MTESPTPPTWVRKRDGNRVPFDADKISQALFAATESLGHPDAFLARELTDGVLHFLAVEKDDDTLTTAQIAEIVGKTVRELGQPALAEVCAAFALRNEPHTGPTEDSVVLRAPRTEPPRLFIPQLLREYTRQAVYSSQILAAQNDGLLTITGFEAPGDLASRVVGPLEVLEEGPALISGVAVFEGHEHFWTYGREGINDVYQLVNETVLVLRHLRLGAVVNLNSAVPPPWTSDLLTTGPLFEEQSQLPDEATLFVVAGEFLHRFTGPQAKAAAFHVYWHLAERDFTGDRLVRAARLAAQGGAISFVFDRPRRPLLLAPGMDRQHTAILLTVGLHLPRLAAQPGLRENVTLFLQKLGSLARLAVSAGVQKREYLRRLERAHSTPLTMGFLLDRARLVVSPIGLDHVVQQLHGRGLSSGGAALDLGKQIVTRLRDVLKQEARTSHLDACLDGPDSFILADQPLGSETVVGLTAWDATAATKNQLRASGALHAIAERGTMALFIGRDEYTPEGITERLRQAWESSEVASLCLRPSKD